MREIEGEAESEREFRSGDKIGSGLLTGQASTVDAKLFV
jgi:hypothetical protein